MTGKQLLHQALRGQETPRPGWVPFVGCHGGQLIDISAKEYLQSADRIVEGLTRARELYRPDGLPVMFDLQLEAEVLGCELRWSDDTPPSVVSHPLAGREDWSVEQLPELDLSAGRLPLAFEATGRLAGQMGDEVALYGLICGPFTLSLHLLGNEIFLEMFDRPDRVKELVRWAGRVGQQMAQAYLDAGCDVIAVVDPMLSQISPGHLTEFVADALDELFDAIGEAGGISSLFVCGDATRNLDVMCQRRCDNISVDENIDLARLRDLARSAGKSFGGNLKLTTALLLGSADDARRDAIACIETGGKEGFVLAPGCDLPYATPADNVAAAGLMALDEYQRKVAKTAAEAPRSDRFEDIVLPNYDSPGRVILDVITLDSASCAPCQYMVDAAGQAAGKVGEFVEVREHKITGREGIGMLTKLGVSNLPTICIDGRQEFVSLIPDQNTLIEAIRHRAAEKGMS